MSFLDLLSRTCFNYLFRSRSFCIFVEMKAANKYRTNRPSKGERLHWSPLKDATVMPVTEEMLQSRRISEKEIQTRQRPLNGQISLLVP